MVFKRTGGVENAGEGLRLSRGRWFIRVLQAAGGKVDAASELGGQNLR